MEKLPAVIRKALVILSAVAIAVAIPVVGHAEDGQNRKDAAEALDPSSKRYGLIETDGDILRIDHETGAVSFCRKAQGAWRCMPVPLAEEAYLAEIEELNQKVDRLTARIHELEAQAEKAVPKPDLQDGEQEPQEPQAETAKPTPHLSDEDEEQLERMMQFSEKAMRRFFGFMRDLQNELKGE